MPALRSPLLRFICSRGGFRWSVAVSLLSIAVLLARFPAHNGDLPFYIAAAFGVTGMSDSAALSRAAEAIRSELPQAEAAAHLRNLQNAPADFLDFYRIKAGYTHLIALFQSLGMPSVTATVIPSLMAFVLLGWVLFSWLREMTNSPAVFPLAFLLLVFTAATQLGRMSAPDGPEQCFLFWAIYRIRGGKRVAGTILLLLFSLVFRPDNLVAVAGLLLLMWRMVPRSSEPGGWLSGTGFGFSIIASVVCCISLNAWSEPRFWWFRPVPYPGVADRPDPQQLLHFLLALARGPLPFLLALAAVVFAVPDKSREVSGDSGLKTRTRTLLIFLALMFPVRYLIFPHYEDRFFVTFYLAGFLLLADAATIRG